MSDMNANCYVKTLPYAKVTKAAVQLEYDLQTYIALKYDFTPKTRSIKWLSDCAEISMDKVVNSATLAEKFTDNPECVPDWIWT